jgi:hypothetical protein
MTELPVPIRRRLTRLARRLALGLFLEVWPRWAAAGLLVAGLAVLACRILVPRASPFLTWLWLVPVAALIPAAIVCRLRAFRPEDVVAVADSLAGGRGMLLAVSETRDTAWGASSAFERAAAFSLPRLRLWRALGPAAAAAVFLAAALAVPQRTARASHTALAGDIARDLAATVDTLKQQQMITPEEEQALDQAIERIRQGAEQRVDAAAWEGADALRESMAAELQAKQGAAKWAEESLARFDAAASAAGGTLPDGAAEAAELSKALEQLAKSGLLAGAPEQLKGMLASGKLPADAESLRKLSAALGKYLKETNGRFGELPALGREFGRFDPREFPLGGPGTDGDGEPGRGGVTRGRADAELTWGQETAPFDRFKATPLPPGAARSPDDWAPMVELPGAPQAAPELSASAGARQYGDAIGQGAWRRALAPRHQSAVKKYFAR